MNELLDLPWPVRPKFESFPIIEAQTNPPVIILYISGLSGFHEFSKPIKNRFDIIMFSHMSSQS